MAPGGRARIYAPFFPFPLTEGSFWVVHDQARVLASMGWEVELVVWKDTPGEISRKLRAPSRDPFGPDLLITSPGHARLRELTAAEWLQRVPPTAGPTRESSLSRTLRVFRSLISPWASPEIFHYPSASDRRSILPPADLGIYHYSFAYPWLSSGRPAPEARTFVHFHNLESELARIRIGRPGPRDSVRSLVHRVNARKLARHEQALGDHADELWFLSATDMETYEGSSTRRDLRLVPPTMDPRVGERRRAAFHDCRASIDTVNVGFLGGGYFEPNRASMEWIVDRLAPELRRRGFTGTVVMVGRDVPDTLREKAREYKFFEWPGFVPDLEPFWAGLSFFMVPHVKGSGVRIKLLEALTSGVPVLATPAAVAPLPPDLADRPLLLVSDDPCAWAERIMSEETPLATRERYGTPDVATRALAGERMYDFLGTPGD